MSAEAAAPAHAVGGEVWIERHPRALVVRFAEAHATLSWALVNGGARAASSVAWVQVDDPDLRPPVDARRYLAARLAEVAAPAAVGLLTSRVLDAYEDVRVAYGDVEARCIATVGLGNALRAGDPPGPSARIGTINVMVRVNVALESEALVEALAIAVEARTAAVLEARLPSGRTFAPATGTGTDCLVVAAPLRGDTSAYAGKHTAVGHVVGASVLEAVTRGAAAWKRERGLA